MWVTPKRRCLRKRSSRYSRWRSNLADRSPTIEAGTVGPRFFFLRPAMGRGNLQRLDRQCDHEPSKFPLSRPAGTFSPIGGEGWDEGGGSVHGETRPPKNGQAM